MLFVLFLLSFDSSFYSWIKFLYLIYVLQILPPSENSLFILLTFSLFLTGQVCNFDEIPSVLLWIVLLVASKKYLATPNIATKTFSNVFPRNVNVLGFVFRSVVHYELIFFKRKSTDQRFFLLHMDIYCFIIC